MQSAIEDVEFLVRSQARVGILTELADGPRSKRELRERIGVDRTTIQRNLDALDKRGWIHREGEGYALDPCAELVVEEFGTFVESVDLADRLQPALQLVDPALLDVDVRCFADATITTAKPGDPWAMVNAHVRRLAELTDAVLMIPLTGLNAKRTLHDRVVDHGARVELIVSPSVLETFRTDPDYIGYYEALKENERMTYRIYEDEMPFYLGLIDDELVQLGVDEDGEPRALVESRNEEVRAWAERRLDAFRAEAEPVDD